MLVYLLQAALLSFGAMGLALQVTWSFPLLAYVHLLYREISPSTYEAYIGIQETNRGKYKIC